MIRILQSLFFLSCFIGLSQNQINMDSWITGTTGAAPPYAMQGSTSQNSRVTINGPYDESAVVWKAEANGANGFNGGFRHDNITLNTGSTYRFSYWMRSEGSNNCQNYAGYVPYGANGGSQILTTEGTAGGTTNYPYFYNGYLPNDKWYLVVGYIHPHSYGGSAIGGVYDPSAVNVITPDILPASSFAVSNFKFPNGVGYIDVQTRNFMWVCAIGEAQYSYDPRIEEINGQEPQIIEILTGNFNSGENGSTVWATNTNGIHYNSGNVGIGTEDPGNEWKLAVNGKIRSKEIKVETGWADYVFEEGYQLPSLKEVEQHIAEKGHLMNIPSAAEVEVNGIELGEMNKLLLEKIEELTLYILMQDEQLKRLPELEERLQKLENKNPEILLKNEE